MEGKFYVKRRKISPFKQTELPETTYHPDCIPSPKSIRSIEKSNFSFQKNNQKQPKQTIENGTEIEDISSDMQKHNFCNPYPDFGTVDIRVNETLIFRTDQNLQTCHDNERKINGQADCQYNQWKMKLKQEDEIQRNKIIEERHQMLDDSRKKAISARKKLSKQKLREGQKLRDDINSKIKEMNQEQRNDLEIIKQSKENITNNGQLAMEKIKKEKREEMIKMKKKLRSDLVRAKKEKNNELEAKKKMANKINFDVKNHIITRKDKFINQIEITKTNFLAAKSEEEVAQILIENKEMNQRRIQQLNLEHRQKREEKIEKICLMFERDAKYQEEQAVLHTARRNEKIETARKLEEERKAHEDEQLLKLQKKIENKKAKRMKEAEEQDEQARIIGARNRFLALNKQTLQAKTFNDWADGALREAKSRQTNITKKKSSKTQKKDDQLVNLNKILGLV